MHEACTEQPSFFMCNIIQGKLKVKVCTVHLHNKSTRYLNKEGFSVANNIMSYNNNNPYNNTDGRSNSREAVPVPVVVTADSSGMNNCTSHSTMSGLTTVATEVVPVPLVSVQSQHDSTVSGFQDSFRSSVYDAHGHALPPTVASTSHSHSNSYYGGGQAPPQNNYNNNSVMMNRSAHTTTGQPYNNNNYTRSSLIDADGQPLPLATASTHSNYSGAQYVAAAVATPLPPVATRRHTTTGAYASPPMAAATTDAAAMTRSGHYVAPTIFAPSAGHAPASRTSFLKESASSYKVPSQFLP